MIYTYLITVAVILLLMVGWVLVQHFTRLYAAKHPEFGPSREERGGACGDCGCGGTTCNNSEDDSKT
ncbi:MAG: hypothetical protein BWK79_01320 [Beggiatoa sp. IS2]|nr:MAG: hypothetical protein BWK79_01320 [Beggiatoa sp. IS2]